MEKIRVLYLAASPAGGPPEQEIDVDADYDAIHEAIDAAGGTDHFEFRRVWGVRSKDLVDQLRNWHPHIVHFSGHGLRGKGLVFTDDLGAAILAAPAGLTGIFKGARNDGLRLVVLMTCYGLPLARALAPHVQVAIGIEDRLADDSATEFNRAFYAELAGGRSLQEAYDRGIAVLRLSEGTHARNRPELAPGPSANLRAVLVPREASHAGSAPIRTEGQLAADAGLRFLDLRLYNEAISRLQEAVRHADVDAHVHYYLALAMLRGRRPFTIETVERAQAIERHVRAAVAGSPRAVHYYLWAWVKQDYFVRNRFHAQAPPTVGDLLAQAARLPMEHAELQQLLAQIPADAPADDPVRACLWRQSF